MRPCSEQSCPAGRLLLQAAYFAGLVGFTTPAAAQGFLQQLRDEVRTPRPAEAAPAKPGESAGRHESSDGCSQYSDSADAGLTELFAIAAVGVATSPIWIPRKLVGDEDLGAGYFTRYPYQCDFDGLLFLDASEDYRQFPWLADEQYNWLWRMRAEYTDDFNGLTRLGGAVLLDTASRFGLDTEFNYRRELTRPGGDDHLWTGDCNLVFRFAQSPKVQMRAGLGFNWLADARDFSTGLNLTYGGDWFVREPWVLSGTIDWGRLGNATLFHGRATVGVQLRRLEIYTGFDHYGVTGVRLNGLIGGLGWTY